MNTIKFAKQGIRQMASLPEANDGQVLKPGSSFILHNTADDGTIVYIEQGTIGIVHKEDGDCTVSVIRDDCKAARRALRNAKETEISLSTLSGKIKTIVSRVRKQTGKVNPDHYESGPPSEEHEDLKKEI